MFSKFLRQSHMYLALFLTPWVLVYALSTLFMNHRARPASENRESEAPQTAWVFEQERILDGSVNSAHGVLVALELDGPHFVNKPAVDGSITIFRQDAFRPRRVIWSPLLHKAKVERQDFHARAFVERLHKRFGYGSTHRIGNIWSAMVDLTAASIVFWAVSGVWLWFELRALRKWGLVFLGIGVALFAFFVVTI